MSQIVQPSENANHRSKRYELYTVWKRERGGKWGSETNSLHILRCSPCWILQSSLLLSTYTIQIPEICIHWMLFKGCYALQFECHECIFIVKLNKSRTRDRKWINGKYKKKLQNRTHNSTITTMDKRNRFQHIPQMIEKERATLYSFSFLLSAISMFKII